MELNIAESPKGKFDLWYTSGTYLSSAHTMDIFLLSCMYWFMRLFTSQVGTSSRLALRLCTPVTYISIHFYINRDLAILIYCVFYGYIDDSLVFDSY